MVGSRDKSARSNIPDSQLHFREFSSKFKMYCFSWFTGIYGFNIQGRYMEWPL